MFMTSEMRWFFPGTTPPKVADWFAGVPGILSPIEQRKDSYLVLGAQSIGIKLRLGYIEVKWRISEFGPYQINQKALGRMEKWKKMSFLLAAGHETAELDYGSGKDWIAVKKERRLRSYTVDMDGSVVPLDPGESVDSGCAVELARLALQDQPWWTLAFESYGEVHRLGDYLRTTSAWFLNQGESPRLPGECSCVRHLSTSDRKRPFRRRSSGPSPKGRNHL